MNPTGVLIAVAAALLAGFAAGWLLARARAAALHGAALAQARTELQVALATASERLRGSEHEARECAQALERARIESRALRDALDLASNEQARLDERAARVPALEAELAQSRQEVAELRQRQVELQTRTDQQRAGMEAQLRTLQEARVGLADQFRQLATEILDEKSRRFTEQQQAGLGALLEPLRTKLVEFQGKVEQVYVQEGKDRSALQEQVRQLMSLNRTLSEDARNLAAALKGSSKAQGQWGELVLERVLESSGLRRGVEYLVQDSRAREDGSRAQPDVVILLPEERRLVVDAKVSLVAYERAVSADTDEARADALKAHLESVRAHIRGLSDKRYQALYGLKSLDFVLAFVPVEPAFMMAVTHDRTLFDEAWARNVLLVSPSTLLFVVRTVAHLWRQEAQNRNAQEIARRGAELYDKLCGFVDDLRTVGTRLDQARVAYAAAEGKLSLGRGNAIRQAELLRELGVKPSRALPQPLVEAACAPLAGAAASAPPQTGASDGPGGRVGPSDPSEPEPAPAAHAGKGE